MKVQWANSAMVGSWMMLCPVVGVVVGSGFPVDDELALLDTVFEPVESHVDGFGAFLLDCVIGDALSTSVVSLDRSWWLGMA